MPVLHRYFEAGLRDGNAADDQTQEVLVQVIRALPRYRSLQGVPFGSWVYRIAYRQLLRHLRESRRLNVTSPEEMARLRERVEGSSELMLGWLRNDRLAAAYEELPEDQRRVLGLKFVFGLQSSEVAKILGLSAGNVRQLQRRALNTLERETTPRPEGGRPLPCLRREPAMPVLQRRLRMLPPTYTADIAGRLPVRVAARHRQPGERADRLPSR